MSHKERESAINCFAKNVVFLIVFPPIIRLYVVCLIFKVKSHHLGPNTKESFQIFNDNKFML